MYLFTSSSVCICWDFHLTHAHYHSQQHLTKSNVLNCKSNNSPLKAKFQLPGTDIDFNAYLNYHAVYRESKREQNGNLTLPRSIGVTKIKRTATTLFKMKWHMALLNLNSVLILSNLSMLNTTGSKVKCSSPTLCILYSSIIFLHFKNML